MKYKYTYETGTLEKGDKEWFEKVNRGYKCTGETLKEDFKGYNEKGLLVDGGGATYAVMKGRFTRFGMCRDCGDHYIIARYSRYDRIDKGTFKRTIDVEDR